MKFETRLKKAINKILDLVSAKEQDWSKKSGWRRWGFDTDCGDNEELVNEAINILKKYHIIKDEPINLIIEEIKEVCFEDGELNPFLVDEWLQDFMSELGDKLREIGFKVEKFEWRWE